MRGLLKTPGQRTLLAGSGMISHEASGKACGRRGGLIKTPLSCPRRQAASSSSSHLVVVPETRGLEQGCARPLLIIGDHLLWSPSIPRKRGRFMHHPLPLSYATRREVVERVVPLYQEASLAQKVHLLDQVVAVTGYTRTYAISLLNHAPPG